MAGPGGQAQRRRTQQDIHEQRMRQADDILRQGLMSSGYNRSQADEIIRLAHQLYTVRQGRPAPAPGTVTLEPTGVQSRIRLSDLTHARDFLMAVEGAPSVPLSDFSMGLTRGRDGRMGPITYNLQETDRRGRPRSRRVEYSVPMYGGPERAQAAVREAVRPAPVRTYTYQVGLRDRQGREYAFEISTNINLRNVPGATASERLYNLLYNPPEGRRVIAATSGDRSISVDDFRAAYASVYRFLADGASISIYGGA